MVARTQTGTSQEEPFSPRINLRCLFGYKHTGRLFEIDGLLWGVAMTKDIQTVYFVAMINFAREFDLIGKGDLLIDS